jgi:uncharacterized circularly permuted ATP-grasp superfamily protein
VRTLSSSTFHEPSASRTRSQPETWQYTPPGGRIPCAARANAGRRRDTIFMRQGITFEVGGADGDEATDRPFPLDLVPRILPVEEWRTIKRGLAQRIRALNRFVDDVYHGREIVHDGVVPWPLVV